jgi:uncharacterized protein (TIGR01777 family)
MEEATLKVLITGSSGLIGSALARSLSESGQSVTPLKRSRADVSGDAPTWDPRRGTIDAARLEGLDAVVHLAGEGIGDHRWSDGHKARVLMSRVEGTSLLAETLAGLEQPPATLLSGSAVGFYGSRGAEVLDEHSGPGDDFLAQVCVAWEEATRAAEDAGIRVAHLRSGIVLSATGGALKPQLLPFRLGLGGKLGAGDHYWSWISIDDEIGAIRHLLERNDISGPVNLTAPQPVTNAAFTKALGRVLHRPAVLTVPRMALRARFGKQMTDEMLLASQRAVPRRLLGRGYEFADTEVEAALRRILGA